MLIRISSLLISAFVMLLSPSCINNTEFVSTLDAGKARQDSGYQAGYKALIDLYNYEMIGYVLESGKDTTAFYKYYQQIRPDSIKYGDILHAIPDSPFEYKELSQEINNLKNNDTLLVTNPDIGRYLTETIFALNNPGTHLQKFYDERNYQSAAIPRNKFLERIKVDLNLFAQKNNLIAQTGGFSIVRFVAGMLLVIFLAVSLVKIFLRRGKKKQEKRKNNDPEKATVKAGEPKSEVMENNSKSNKKERAEKDDDDRSRQYFIDKLNDLEKVNNEQEKLIITLNKKIEELENKLRQKENIATIAEEVVSYKAPGVAKNEDIAPAGDIFYFPPPNSQGFPVVAGSPEKRTYDAFIIQVKRDKAFFKLMVEDASIMQRAIESSENYILPVCEIDSKSEPFGKASKIKVLKEGVLTKEGEFWRLSEKSLIKLL
jgi:hypothetical protein